MIRDIMLEREFTLSSGTFIALSSPTRIRILKLLQKRKMTVSEISKSLNMSKSTVSEHIEKLLKAELVKREESGKWVYYSLTEFGRRVAEGRKIVAKIVICVSVTLIVTGLIQIYGYLNRPKIVLDKKPEIPIQSIDNFTSIIYNNSFSVLLIALGLVIILLAIRRPR